MAEHTDINAANMEKYKEEARQLTNSQNKYDDILKKKRAELRAKQGALGISSDLDIDPDFRAPRQHPRSGGSNAVSYKSRLHQEIRD